MKNLIINEIYAICDYIIVYNFSEKLEYYTNEYNLLIRLMSSCMQSFDKDVACKASELLNNINTLSNICDSINYAQELKSLSLEDSSIPDLMYIKEDVSNIYNTIHKYIRDVIFTDNEQYDVILTITAGSGGSEAEDWAGMLQRMYLMWAKNNKMSVDIINTMYSMEAINGIKKSDILISGKNVYGLLQNESGIHRLIRKSPFSKKQARHTSFASVKVLPSIDDNIDIVIDERNDVRIDTLRGHGAGGQHRNKTDSAVRLTHLETGIVIFCQSERSQYSNKANAFKILRSRLYELELQKKALLTKQYNNTINDNSWGYQIRSYVLHPTQRVKDHRTNFICNDFNYIINGNIDGMISSLLMSKFNNNG